MTPKDFLFFKICIAVAVIFFIARLLKTLRKKTNSKINDLMDAEFLDSTEFVDSSESIEPTESTFPNESEKSDETEESEENSDENEENEDDFSKEFFIRSQNGEKSQYFLNVSSPQDCSFIRSILYSEGIPSLVDFSHMNALYGVRAGVENMVRFNRISILCNDYDEAFEILTDYVKQKINVLKQKEPHSPAVKTAVILLSLIASKPLTQKQEILGISVYPKQDSI